MVKGKAVVFDVDVIGGINLKKQMKEQCLSVYKSIHIDVWKGLRKRQTESRKISSTNIKSK